jgi:hypothetical protein
VDAGRPIKEIGLFEAVTDPPALDVAVKDVAVAPFAVGVKVTVHAVASTFVITGASSGGDGVATDVTPVD